jgi:hypothetical protein
MKREKEREKWLGRKSGFTLVELIIPMLIAGVFMVAVIAFLGQSFGLTSSNVAFSVAQRATLSSVEMLPEEIPYAGEVEIISRDASSITDDLLENGGWHYIARRDDQLFHIYWDGAGRVDETIPGSEHISGLVFRPDAISSEDTARILRIGVTADYGSGEDIRTVSLDRSLLVHATLGVMAEDAGIIDSSTEGPMMRYKMLYPILTPTVQMFAGNVVSSPSVSVPNNTPAFFAAAAAHADDTGLKFDYTAPVTGGVIKNFDWNTQLDAQLSLPGPLMKNLDPEHPPIFTWIAMDRTLFENHPELKNDPEKLMTFLQSELSDELKDIDTKVQTPPDQYGHFLKRPYLGDADFNAEDKLEPLRPNGLRVLYAKDSARPVTEDNKLEDFFRMKPETVGVAETGEDEEGNEITVYKEEDGVDKFSVGSIGNELLPNAYDYYQGAYMVVVAHYRRKGKTEWNMTPAYTRLGEFEDDSLFTNVRRALLGGNSGTGDGVTYFNNESGQGALTFEFEKDRYGADTGRGAFTVSNGTSGAAPKVLMKFRPEDFKHLIPRDGTSPDHGVTNYALYIDTELPVSMLNGKEYMSGGYGVVLNGSQVWAHSGIYRTTGYMFQYDPGAGGFIIRYIENYADLTSATPSDMTSHGVRPMYFYDASKPNYPAPKSVSYFTGTGSDTATESENFNLNALASADAPLNYRIPFMAYNGNYPGEINYGGFMRRRDPGGQYIPYPRSGVSYGVTNFIDTVNNASPFSSPYQHKLMQSWHKYSDVSGVTKTAVLRMTDAAYKDGDTRIGFRWDGSWNVTPDIWKQRHILKLTILEITQDINTGDIDPGWTYPKEGEPDDGTVHHAGDMFIRAELIQLKRGTTDFYNSRNYVYSKPIWYGKFRGDAWRGDGPSPFKKMGNSMVSVVADPEPRAGDSQSYRRRSMRVRSWKDSFLGWNFKEVDGNRYKWWNFVTNNAGDSGLEVLPPDFFVWNQDPNLSGRDENAREGIDTVWTPPIAVDLNRLESSQRGDSTTNTFGQYQRYINGQNGQTQTTQRETRGRGAGATAAYTGDYTGGELYGRLSLWMKGNPWMTDVRDSAGQKEPLYGLYAMRGWDHGTSYRSNVTYDDQDETDKRFLMVVQGLRMPYRPYNNDNGLWKDNRNKETSLLLRNPMEYKPDRDRVLALRFWASGGVSKFKIHDMWIGEGFSLRETREILGLRDSLASDDVREFYIKGVSNDFYLPRQDL